MRTCDLIEDKGADFRFPKDFGNGIEFTHTCELGGKEETHRLRSVIRGLGEKPREASLRLTSWVGVSIGAVHHYAKISLGYPSIEIVADGKNWGYGLFGDPDLPFGVQHIELEITRPSDKRDVKYDKDQAAMNPGDILYGRRKLGDPTYQFWSEADAKKAAVKFFKTHFGPGWILVPDSWVEDERPEFART